MFININVFNIESNILDFYIENNIKWTQRKYFRN